MRPGGCGGEGRRGDNAPSANASRPQSRGRAAGQPFSRGCGGCRTGAKYGTPATARSAPNHGCQGRRHQTQLNSNFVAPPRREPDRIAPMNVLSKTSLAVMAALVMALSARGPACAQTPSPAGATVYIINLKD